MTLIFATNNQHKTDEIRFALRGNPSMEIISLKDAGIQAEIPEPYATLEQNASHKSHSIYQLTGNRPKIGCFSEDTGLEVDALGGEPGVHSARYAGDERSFDKNIEKLLDKLKGNSNRRARFRTIISLIINEQETLFEGACPGTITHEKRGRSGFGYDPVFMPDGAIHTFAEMSLEEKNLFSHRKKAVDKLLAYLSQVQVSEKPQ